MAPLSSFAADKWNYFDKQCYTMYISELSICVTIYLIDVLHLKKLKKKKSFFLTDRLQYYLQSIIKVLI